MAPSIDEELSSDAEAFAAFYDDTCVRAFSLASHLSRDAGRAERLVAAAYAQLWRGQEATREFSDPRAQLEFLICRAAGTRDVPGDPSAWSRLTATQRQVLELVVRCRLARRDVARALGMSVDTVDLTLSSGLRVLGTA